MNCSGRFAWAGLALAALSALASTGGQDGETVTREDPGSDRWRFRVLLDEKPIGYHSFEITRTGDELQVNAEARFQVDVLFFTAYRYVHDNQETWRNDCLRRIEATTNDNGTRYEVTGSASKDVFELERNDEDRTLEGACVQSFAYWNPGILQADRLLNAQTGKFQNVRVERVARTTFDTPGGTVDSEEFVIGTEEGDIRLWYQVDNHRWLGLETRARGDRTLRYVPDALPESPPTDARLAYREDERTGGALPRP